MKGLERKERREKEERTWVKGRDWRESEKREETGEDKINENGQRDEGIVSRSKDVEVCDRKWNGCADLLGQCQTGGRRRDGGIWCLLAAVNSSSLLISHLLLSTAGSTTPTDLPARTFNGNGYRNVCV